MLQNVSKFTKHYQMHKTMYKCTHARMSVQKAPKCPKVLQNIHCSFSSLYRWICVKCEQIVPNVSQIPPNTTKCALNA